MKNAFEAFVGFAVLLVSFLFLMFAYNESGSKSTTNNLSLIAKFSQADGISNGSDVKISGIKVGTVKKEFLDQDTLVAVLELSIDESIKLPKDSSAQILSDGLLGGKYISIFPGSDEDILKHGNEIKFTQSSVNIETLIGKMIFNSADKK